ncbi:hypothetical protein Tco_1386954 [Tanacetum coccineum]
MDLLAFIRTTDLTKVKVGERQRAEDEPRLLYSTVRRVVPLLLVAPARTEGELEASVDKLFDEGGSGKKTVVVDAGGSSHPTKKLKEDHETPSETSVAVRGEVIRTLPFVTSSVSSTPEHEDGNQTNSVAGTNIRTVCAPQRFVISSDSSHHSGANVVEDEVDSLIRSSAPLMTTATIVTATVNPASFVKEKFVEPSLFGAGSSLAGEADHTMGGFSDLTGSDFIVGGIRTVNSPDTDLQKVFFASICGMQHEQLFTEFNIGATRQMSLSAEVRMCAEYNIKEKRRLKSVAEERAELLKVREREVEDLK